MKAVIYSSVFTVAWFSAMSVFGQGTCHNGGGYPNGGQPEYRYPPSDPYADGGSPSYPIQTPVPLPGLAPQAAPIAQVAPAAPASAAARITVVSASAVAGNSTASTAATIRSAKLTVVAADTPKTSEVIDEKIASLVGTWKAVARQGDGQLTTVELHLDNRGWAELTVPGSDGRPSTTKSRVNLDHEELKLTDADKVVSLGKLVDFNTRQMVLERAEGQVTFVRL